VIRKGKLIVEIHRAIRTSFTDVRVQMRSCTGSLDFYARQACGDYMADLQGCFAVLCDQAKLQKMDFLVEKSEGAKAGLAAAEATHPVVEDEDAWIQLAAKLAIATCKCRLRYLKWYSEGYPAKLAQLLSTSPSEVKAGLQHMKQTLEAWTAAQSREEAIIKKFVNKSFMKWSAVKLFFEEAANLEFKTVDEHLHSHISEVFALGQTAIVEDGFHHLRSAETRDQPNQRMSHNRVWSVNVQRDLLGKDNKYVQVPWRAETLTKDEPKSVPAQCFSGPTQRSKTSFDMSNFVSHSPSGFWPTYSASSFPSLVAEMALIRHCHANDAWTVCSLHWLCVLMVEGILVRRTGTARWLFCMGHVQGLQPPAIY
jgi:hypothetical protein